MCVIIGATLGNRPSRTTLERAFDRNGSGAGVAWRENGLVYWEKGLDIGRFVDLCQRIPLPFIGHCRIPTVGGPDPALTHPFPIDRNSSNALSGKTKGWVLFHNGHWHEWKKELREVAKSYGAKMPNGKWSDSRAMAFVAACAGLGYLDTIDGEKMIAFGPKENDLEFFGPTHHGAWCKVGAIGVDEVWASNRSCEGTVTYMGGGPYDNTSTMCKNRSCCRRDINAEGFCPAHDPKKDEKKAAEADKEEHTAVHLSGQTTSLQKIEPGSTTDTSARESGGTPDQGPFHSCSLAYTRWRKGEISHNAFKRARKEAQKNWEQSRFTPPTVITTY